MKNYATIYQKNAQDNSIFLMSRLGEKAFPSFIHILHETKQYKLKQILLQADYEIHKECGLSIPEY